MNKQELIEKLREHGAWCTECHDINGKKDRYVKAAKVRELLDQLDEPQKVKVPECVAGYIVWCHSEGLTLWEVFKTIRGMPEKVWEWLKDEEHQAIFSKAYTDGYEVEEEPKWKIINDQKYCLTSIEAGYGNSLHWAFDSTKKKPILFDNEETAMYTAYITGGTVEKV
ncbi:DUF1642 domain-containing protein [Enterococcus malodoratus]|uniref:DUF1642 domain-containing protein n=1 Tax=Enterococcus malodoratus TaxID=71451 RepID=UPI0022E34EF8|nr:DUF1642 domain-containing protein [Enterococcus malodoratus]